MNASLVCINGKKCWIGSENEGVIEITTNDHFVHGSGDRKAHGGGANKQRRWIVKGNLRFDRLEN